MPRLTVGLCQCCASVPALVRVIRSARRALRRTHEVLGCRAELAAARAGAGTCAVPPLQLSSSVQLERPGMAALQQQHFSSHQLKVDDGCLPLLQRGGGGGAVACGAARPAHRPSCWTWEQFRSGAVDISVCTCVAAGPAAELQLIWGRCTARQALLWGAVRQRQAGRPARPCCWAKHRQETVVVGWQLVCCENTGCWQGGCPPRLLWRRRPDLPPAGKRRRKGADPCDSRALRVVHHTSLHLHWWAVARVRRGGPPAPPNRVVPPPPALRPASSPCPSAAASLTSVWQRGQP